MSITVYAQADEIGSFCLTNKEFASTPLKEIAIGQVVYLRERNMYDDSDFFAAYFDIETNTLHEVMYATTRGYCITGASVDATAEVRQAYEAWREAEYKAACEKYDGIRRQIPTIGDMVEVIKTSKNKAAFKSGTCMVTWIGESKFKRGHKIARVEFNGMREYFDFECIRAIGATMTAHEAVNSL